MQTSRRTILTALLAGACLATASQASAADTYPSRPIRIIVPFAAGGGGDYIVRAWSQRFSEVLKQSVVVENRGGGNTVAGTVAVARAAPDGYTLLFTSTALSTNPTLLPDLPYKTPDDFAPIASVISYPFAMVARTDLEANTIPEIVALARKQPNTISISTSGEGSGSHLAAELFMDSTRAPLLLIPYRGASPAVTDVAAGHVDLTFTGMSQVKPFLDSQRVKLIASSGTSRLLSAPDTKTIAEQGVPGFNAVVWWGMLAPAGTPREIVDKLNDALRISMNDPEVVKRLAMIDGEVKVSTPQEFDKMIREEVARWRRLLKPSNTASH